MTIRELQAGLEEIERQAELELARVRTLDELRAAESRIVGRKGRIGQLIAAIPHYEPADRKQAGQLTNAAKARLSERFAERAAVLKLSDQQRERELAAAYDPTLPVPARQLGCVHPVTQVQWEVEDTFERLGFVVATGPEMETDYYNFEALNIPAWHPARDMQDTFWLTNGMLLRTHTSPCQVRAMERFGPPLRVIAPGRCFRHDTVDASHENTFHQIEGLMIDRNISIANLIAIMKLLLREVFRRDVHVRLRPGYFPFVEPGFELDMSCRLCDGAGCPTCKHRGWIEILPCGMVHPNVLRFGGIDPHDYTGFAFGLGLTRLAMMKFGVRDIRILNSGDIRALVPPEKLTGTPIWPPSDSS